MKNYVWIKNELRLLDNPLLKSLENCAETTLFYWLPSQFNHWSPHRRNFLIDSLKDFSDQIQTLDQVLYIHSGDQESLCKALQISSKDRLICSKEFATYEKQAIDEFKLITEVVEFEQNTLFKQEELAFDLKTLPKTFTPFRFKMDKVKMPAQICDRPKYLGTHHQVSLLSFDEWFSTQNLKGESNPHFCGGESQGLKRLNYYLWESSKIESYKQTRNGLLDFDDSSKLSPWLALGCLSANYCRCQIEKYESEKLQNESTYWLYFELLWREYFKWSALQHGSKFFHLEGIQARKLPWQNDQQAKFQFKQWCEGETGDDFVDANMLELKHTGWMSNRGRQNVASYLAKHFKIDWRWGAEWFELRLIDYDATSNWGNWAYLAGVGHDKRDRFFNTQKQAQVYDADGTYRKKFLNRKQELAD